MKVGVTLPTFRDDAPAIEGAQRAEELGLDGVFVFDHLWPMGAPERPGVVGLPRARRGGRGHDPAHQLRARSWPASASCPTTSSWPSSLSLQTMAPGRLIAGLGTGDRKSAAENLAFGIPFDPPDERRLGLRECARHVLGAGVPVWVGGGVARHHRARRRTRSRRGREPVGGPARGGGRASQAALRGDVGRSGGRRVSRRSRSGSTELAGAGATWAVCAWPESMEAVAEAAAFVRSG